jgi:glucose-1-phosphate thymidylyltransferase
MIAIILAGGYAKRLQPLAKNIPKALLKVAGKPVLAYIFEKLNELEEVQTKIISTNLRFELQIKNWLEASHHKRVEIVTDRPRSEGEKPGAIRSLAETTLEINDDCLIIAGDNIFTCSLKPMMHIFERTSSPVVALYNIKESRLAKQYSTAILDHEGRIAKFVEKPVQPETTLIGTCIYIMPRRTLRKLREYLTESEDADSPGNFIQWLHTREKVYGYVLDGYWGDIGTSEQYMMAQHELKNLCINYGKKRL